ncbi:uncharacterized protein LOC120332803 [Styela clava]
MRTTIIIIFSWITTPLCQGETLLHCSPKPGCQIAQCDIAAEWMQDVNLGEYLNNNEYPLTCKWKSGGKPHSDENLLNIMYENAKNIEKVKSELKNSERKFVKTTEHEKELQALREKNQEQDAQIKVLRAALTSMEEKLKKIEKSNHPFITPITTAPPMKDSVCEIKTTNSCYSITIHKRLDIDYYEAENICKKRNSVIAQIYDEKSYETIINHSRKTMPAQENWIQLWIGSTINPLTGDITPTNAYMKWFPGRPRRGELNNEQTHIYIYMGREATNPRQGMVNIQPSFYRNGVLCQLLNY